MSVVKTVHNFEKKNPTTLELNFTLLASTNLCLEFKLQLFIDACFFFFLTNANTLGKLANMYFEENSMFFVVPELAVVSLTHQAALV